MARRRSTGDSDSLELLLDTICNVFGGIILMAILVVLLTQTTAGRLPDPEPEDVERAFLVQRMRFERRQLEQRLDDLNDYRQEISETFQTTTSKTGERLAEAHTSFQEAVEGASERLQQTSGSVNAKRRQRNQASGQFQEAERDRSEQEEELARLQDKLRHAESAVAQQVRLPHRRGAALGQPVYYVVKGKQAYSLADVNWYGGTHRTGQCTATPLGSQDAAAVRPIEGEGYPAPVDGANAGAFRASLMPHSPASHYLVFFVYDDSTSYASFQGLKDVAVEARYAYTVEAVVTEGGAFVVVPVSGHETE